MDRSDMFLCILITVVVVNLVLLRILYVRALVEDWNKLLEIYIANHKRKTKDRDGITKSYSKNGIKYLETWRLKPYYYYHLIHIWTIEKIVEDPFVLSGVRDHTYLENE